MPFLSSRLFLPLLPLLVAALRSCSSSLLSFCLPQKYEHLMQANEKSGSFYLQSKVYR